MDKKEYIVNQLKRTFHKKYENYCITRIIHKLDNEYIQFITQQLFKRPDGKFALADLYFPQLNISVEIDEPGLGHEHQRGSDRLSGPSVREAVVQAIPEALHAQVGRYGEPTRYKVLGPYAVHPGRFDGTVIAAIIVRQAEIPASAESRSVEVVVKVACGRHPGADPEAPALPGQRLSCAIAPLVAPVPVVEAAAVAVIYDKRGPPAPLRGPCGSRRSGGQKREGQHCSDNSSHDGIC